MKFIQSVRYWLFPVVLLIAFLSTPEVRAQGRDAVRVKSVKTKKVRTPEYQTSPKISPRIQDWIEITTEYEIQKDWMDDLEMTYHILLKGGKDKTLKEPYVLLQGTVGYIHIEKKRELKSIMYIHPSVLTRFGDVDSIAVEVKQSGRPSITEGMGNWQQWQKWVQQLTARGGLVLTPEQTPFGPMVQGECEMTRPTAR